MTIELAQRVQQIKPSPTLAVAARAAELKAEGRDIIGLGTGEPDFDTPDNIKQAGIDAINGGFTKYTPVDGLPSLKQAVIDKFKRDNGLDYEMNQILVSVGGKQSFFNLAQALLNPGDEVIIPAPYWVSYPAMVKLASATPVIIEASVEQNFKITPEQLAAAITPKTRLFCINSPSNPSGQLYTKAELTALAEVLKAHPQVLIATDDMYEHIIWTDEPFNNILTVCPELYDRTIVLNGVSKAYAMTGWRIGYAGGPAKLIAAMKKVQSQSTSNPTSIAQKAAEEALNGPQDSVEAMRLAFKERHDIIHARLAGMDNVQCLPADGTFYLFPDVSAIIKAKGFADDVAFAEGLLNEVGVALVPGSAFGTPGCIRLSFATSLDVLNDALDRIERFIEA
jgi:aspartate aminotransferase